MKYVSTGQLIRIALLILMLVAVVIMKRRCGPAAESMFHAFDVPVTDGGLDSR